MSLVLDSLEIKNFRAFKHLRIEKLGRVNLIVGKNNVGKSSVLEALWLYGRRGEDKVIWSILQSHDELNLSTGRKMIPAEELVDPIKYLFHGRQDVRGETKTISVGPLDALEQSLSVSLQWVNLVPAKNHTLMVQKTDYETALDFGRLNPSFVVSYNQSMIAQYSLIIENYLLHQTVSGAPACLFVPVGGQLGTVSASLWDEIVVADLQGDVVSALQIIASDITSVNLIGAKNGGSERVAVVKMKELPTSIPLRSLGEGMNRMFGIALALVNAKDGILLIDEVDTGLHYSVLPDLWKLIFEVAHRLNVQVFATSHSWDCIQAFQQAADANKDEEGILIRLETQDGEVVAVTFDERMLNIAAREHIEVR